ncbi:MAG: glycosyltransferase [Planctomycetota bacterium]
MRVLLFSNLWPCHDQPLHGSFVQERTERLAARLGFDYVVLRPEARRPALLGGRPAAPREERVAGRRVHCVPYVHWPRLGVPRQAARVREAARGPFQRILAELAPDLVDAQYLWPDAVAAAALAREAGLPCIATARGTDGNVLARDPRIAAQLRAALDDVAAVAAVSPELCASLGTLLDREVTWTPNGVDLERYAPAAAPPLRRVVSVGRLVAGKGHERLVRALAKDPGLPPLHLIGDGPERGTLEWTARRLGVADRLVLHGTLDRDEVAAELAHGGVFAFPSHREGWPNAVLEAMASGLPVVASAVGGLPEMVAGAGVPAARGPQQPVGRGPARGPGPARARAGGPAGRGPGPATELGWEPALDRLAALSARSPDERPTDPVPPPDRAFDGQAVHIQEMLRAFRACGMPVTEVALVPQAEAGAGPGHGRGGLWKRLRLPRLLTEALEVAYAARGERMLVAAGERAPHDLIYERHALHCDAGLRAARRLGLPLFVEVNSPMSVEMRALGLLRFARRAERVEREVLGQADRIFVVSEVLGRMLVPLGARPDRIVVTPNGADVEAFAEAARRVAARRSEPGWRPRVLGFVGFPRTWHRLDLALRAVAALAPAHPGLELCVLGEGPAVPALRALAAELGIPDRLVVLGACARAALPARVAELDLCLIPAMNAYASPLKLYDALAAGLPTLAPDQDNLRESVVDGRTAVLFAPGDQDSLTLSLRRMLEDPARTAALGDEGRRALLAADRTWTANAERVRREWLAVEGHP